jgi:hypothetical protein
MPGVASWGSGEPNQGTSASAGLNLDQLMRQMRGGQGPQGGMGIGMGT